MDPDKSPAGARLKEMSDSGLQLLPEAPADLPLKFEPIRINARPSGKKTLYSASLAWSATGDEGDLPAELKRRIKTKRPDLNPGTPTQCILYLAYKNKAGDSCGGEEITLTIGANPNEVMLVKLTEEDTPASVKATLQSASYQEAGFTVPFRKTDAIEVSIGAQNTLALKAPASLPIRFGDINLGTKAKPATGQPRPTWQLVSDRPTFHTLLEAATEKDVRMRGRAVKSLRFILTYKDHKGQPVGTETVDLDLTSDQGALALTRAGKLDQLGGISITPLTATWREYNVRIPLGK